MINVTETEARNTGRSINPDSHDDIGYCKKKNLNGVMFTASCQDFGNKVRGPHSKSIFNQIIQF